MNVGFVNFGTISNKKRIYWETQLLAISRSFSDGLTLFKFNINIDKYKSDHSPALQIELTIFNIYNHFWIYQNNQETIIKK